MTPPYKITDKILNLIAEITHTLGKLDSKGFKHPEPKLRKQNQIRTIQATLAIEGNTLSLDQVTAVLEGKLVAGKAREIQEVKNVVELYRNIDRYSYTNVKNFLTCHKILMNGLVASNGRFREKNVGVLKGKKVSHVAPKPSLVPELVGNIFEWAKSSKTVNLLIMSCVLHYEIEFIHPFEDGNGRIGRYWQSLVLTKYNQVFKFIPMESLIKKNQQAYYDSLEESDRMGESTVFIEFMLYVIKQSLNEFSSEIVGLVESSDTRLEMVQEKFKTIHFSRKDYMVLHKGISSATASRDLAKWVKQGVLKKSGQGNQTKYKISI